MEMRYAADPVRFARMDTTEIREAFLVEQMFEPGTVRLVYSNVDRAIVGSVTPTDYELGLEAGKELAADYFAERREVGIINIGAPGTVTVDDKPYAMDNRDGLYIGRGAKEIIFSSKEPYQPAAYYLLSYPAHTNHPTKHVKIVESEPLHMGTQAESNERTIYKYIHPAGIKSCQLVMGLTELEEGCVWNTMPPHTHERRSEVYMYFDIPDDGAFFHFMGKPDETRHIVVRNRQAVISPSWSIHGGAGTSNYKFIWGMGGKNQDVGDMDNIVPGDIR